MRPLILNWIGRMLFHGLKVLLSHNLGRFQRTNDNSLLSHNLQRTHKCTPHSLQPPQISSSRNEKIQRRNDTENIEYFLLWSTTRPVPFLLPPQRQYLISGFLIKKN
uniref:Uncharacterized protein n=1 Tax=Micrurus spixii TaxID=129469 RepID=A0A2D4MCS1_9SAUR